MDIKLNQFTPDSNWIMGTFDEYEFQAKHFDEPSYYHYGINDGRTSKLWVSLDDELVMRYDRGWDVKPQTEEEIAICKTLVCYLEDLPTRFEIEIELSL